MGPSPTVQPPDEANPASPSISVLDLPVPPEKNSPPLPIGGDSAGADDIRLLPRLAQKIAKMEITNPEVLRVTFAYRCFEERAVALRSSQVDLFSKSKASERISTFWSHSWHGVRYKKIITLMVLYNGRACVLCGTLVAVLIMFLFWMEALPAWYVIPLESRRYGCWSLCTGWLVTALVMTFWRAQTEVFLDRICVNQRNGKMKAQALFSLGGILKRSESMLILWDPTWTERLWCLFELAAFLKSSREQKKELIIRPISFGPASVAVFLMSGAGVLPITLTPMNSEPTTLIAPLVCSVLCGLPVACAAVSAVRNYFRGLDIMEQQLIEISFDKARCLCCARNHISPSGEHMLCDRKVLEECVNLWFGSHEAFEDLVHSEVLEIVSTDLNENVFSTKWVLATTLPFMWGYWDFAASDSTSPSKSIWDSEHVSAGHLLDGLGIWLFFFPQYIHLAACLCRLTRARAANGWEFAKNVAVTFTLGIPLLLMMAGIGLLEVYSGLRCKMERSLAIFVYLLIYAVFIRCATTVFICQA